MKISRTGKVLIAALVGVPTLVWAIEGVEAKIRFQEIAAKAGVQMMHHTRHYNGASAEVLGMFTSGGSSAAVGDYDGDGFDDIFITDSDKGKPNHLFHNNGNMTFTDVAVASGVGKRQRPSFHRRGCALV